MTITTVQLPAPPVVVRERLKKVRLFKIRLFFRRRLLALPRIVRTAFHDWKLDAVTAFGLGTGLLLSIFPIIKGTILQPFSDSELTFLLIWFGILFFRWLSSLAKTGSKHQVTLAVVESYATKLTSQLNQCFHMAQERVEAGEVSRRFHRTAIPEILRTITDTTRLVLGVPEFVVLHSNIMEPVNLVYPGGADIGLVITEYDRVPGGASWTSIFLRDIGAGETFTERRVHAIEDNREPIYAGAFRESRARSWGSFPVLDLEGRPVAVVNVDAEMPYVFTKLLCRGKLMDVLSPHLRVLAEVLQSIQVPGNGTGSGG